LAGGGGRSRETSLDEGDDLVERHLQLENGLLCLKSAKLVKQTLELQFKREEDVRYEVLATILPQNSTRHYRIQNLPEMHLVQVWFDARLTYGSCFFENKANNLHDLAV
jgi:hypothetical protein